ncbi:uncharacterized protein LOC133805673 [Humulus lupulus]|uniref:uncharacterized protein LOC133805673 n=1 Tax=Humulus lupulus TaxID=3486 RepID=UPI002B409C2A|nr:uncharacterized protein LOC133805673 [Humulus lupulus]
MEKYLRALTSDYPKQWSKFLSWAEYHYNTSHHSTIRMTPFQATYGQLPPTITAYTRGSTTIQAVEEDLMTRDTILRQLKHNLQQAQNHMRQQANKKRRNINFNIGDLILVKLQLYQQSTVARRLNSKLCRRYFGPFPVIARAGSVAYKHSLPADYIGASRTLAHFLDIIPSLWIALEHPEPKSMDIILSLWILNFGTC